MVRKTFDEVVLFARTGLNPRTNFKLGNGDNKYITIKNIHNNEIIIDDNTDVVDDRAIELIHKRSQIKKGDILFCSIGRLGDMYIIEDEPRGWDINESVFVFTVDTNLVRQKYFYYVFKNRDTIEYLSKNSSGSTFKSIKMNQLKKMTFDLPSLEQQDLIVNTLDCLSSIISKREQELERFDELIKARFVELFGNPLDKSRANRFFTDCVVFNPKKSELVDLDIDVSFVPMECVGVDGSFSIRETGKASDYYKGYTYFKDGDVLLAKITPCFENGKVAIASGCENGIGFGTTEFHVSRPISGVSNSYWIKYMLKNDLVHNLATINMTGSAGQKRIQTPFFEKLKVYLPPIEQQNQFAAFVKQVDKSKVVVQKALDETQKLFDSLMQEYFG